MNKKIIAVLVAVLVIAAGVGGYIYYKRTPTYSLTLIQDAVKEHNWEKFSHHVDVKELSDSVFDDFIMAAMEEDKTMDSSAKQMAAGFAQMFKPMLTNAVENALKEYVEKGQVGKNDSEEKKGQEQPAEAATDNLVNSAHANEVKFTGVKSTSTDGDLATVALGIRNDKLGRDFELKVSMSQLEDGTWKVRKISNLKEFLKNVQEAEKAKLAELNKPIQDEIDAAVKLGSFAGQVRQEDSFGLSYKLLLTGTAEFSGSKALDSLTGEIMMTDSQGESTVIHYTYKVSGASNGTEQMQLVKDLNIFSDSRLIKARGQGYKYEARVTAMKYKDGSEVKLLEKLP